MANLLKLALIWSIVGIFILLCVAVLTEPPEVKISELGQYLDKMVVVSGFVQDATYKEKVSFIDLSDGTDWITVVVFDKMEKRIYEGDQISVRGKVSLYKGKLEIIADEIACLRCG